MKVGERGRAARRGEVAGVDVVLHDERNAVQRPDQPAGRFQPRVETLGLCQRLVVDGDDGVEGRSALVVGLDAGEVGGDDVAGGGGAGEVGGLDRLDRRLFRCEIGPGCERGGEGQGHGRCADEHRWVMRHIPCRRTRRGCPYVCYSSAQPARGRPHEKNRSLAPVRRTAVRRVADRSPRSAAADAEPRRRRARNTSTRRSASCIPRSP